MRDGLVIIPKASNLVTILVWEWVGKGEEMCTAQFEVQAIRGGLNIRVLNGEMTVASGVWDREKLHSFRIKNLDLTHDPDTESDVTEATEEKK